MENLPFLLMDERKNETIEAGEPYVRKGSDQL
ncbi:hypothetical protein HBHAL_2339 [Halobacillus halophilus DSM 2266]|uniref:Uncharacterized protein n=1 Tax=Halobacillus halophilus (strain ATCC 35676 / DSM 2266 / JCM 20832 / KCTC 3685 / LMG 17431 / NBRC 102448 / NCIMB 2269) TaxID=866895 RepID=I0JKL6_HALH3|nr:hypothetical protein HBHAL_2339 [Halobacillus halophilus DSM 2266]